VRLTQDNLNLDFFQSMMKEVKDIVEKIKSIALMSYIPPEIPV
jgi:hypothetical protein